MTFSIAGRCERTGMFGVAIATSSICVGSRCPHARAGIGAVATQNITDPNLATLVLDRLAAGDSASTAIEHVINEREFVDYRQLTAIDANGFTSHFTGANILGTHATHEAVNCVAAGNLLSSTNVPLQMAMQFNANPHAHIAERLMSALEAGIGAGGEVDTIHSAALKVVDSMPFALVDLRIDWHDTDPTTALRKLWNAYEPQMLDYLNRAVNPTVAPSYGVSGDP